MARRKSRKNREYVPLDIHRITGAMPRTEMRRGNKYRVQNISSERALKIYICPGCNLEIPIAQAHLVAYRVDSIRGEQVAIDERRHWHRQCWRIS